MKLFIWNWTSGGYDSEHARSRKEAIQKARALAVTQGRTLDEKTLYEGTFDELEQVGLCDPVEA